MVLRQAIPKIEMAAHTREGDAGHRVAPPIGYSVGQHRAIDNFENALPTGRVGTLSANNCLSKNHRRKRSLQQG
jgi:hypothetical protein